jgi:glycosyltransferase involved in cell wall biosynthesis
MQDCCGKSARTALVIAARAPGRKAKQAGHRTCARNIIELCQTYQVDLFIVCKASEDFSDIDYFRQICRSVTIRTISNAEGLWNIIRQPRLPLQISARYSTPIQADLKAFAQSHYDLTHFEWTETTVYAGTVMADRQQAFCYDVLTEVLQRRVHGSWLHRLFWASQKAKAQTFELTALSKLDRIFVHTQEDIDDLFSFGVPREKLKVVLPEFYASEATAHTLASPPYRLTMWGAYGRSENQFAARFLIDEVLPKLPPGQFTAVIAGSQSDKFFANSDTVRVTGFVSSVQDVFDNSDIAVIPLFHGSGLKVKVLESLYAGVPVVTTDVGYEGFDGGENDGIYLAQTADAFAQQILRLTSDPEAYRQASLSAARWARRFVSQGTNSVV